MKNVRAMKLKANGAEFESKLADIKRLKKALEEYMNKNFYFQRCAPFTLGEWLEHPNRKLRLEASINGRGVSFALLDNGISLKKDAQYSLEIVRTVHDNLDMAIELAEKMCSYIHRLDDFKAFLKRLDVE